MKMQRLTLLCCFNPPFFAERISPRNVLLLLFLSIKNTSQRLHSKPRIWTSDIRYRHRSPSNKREWAYLQWYLLFPQNSTNILNKYSDSEICIRTRMSSTGLHWTKKSPQLFTLLSWNRAFGQNALEHWELLQCLNNIIFRDQTIFKR